MAVTVEALDSPESIARHLRLPVLQVKEALEFLTSVGLAVHEDGRWRVGTARMHLPADSPLIAKHHTNWRMQAINSFYRRAGDDLHYSSLVTLSDADLLKAKARLIEAIEEVKAIIKDSPGEGVHCFTLDFFRL